MPDRALRGSRYRSLATGPRLLPLLAVLVAGCGGSEPSGPTANPAPTVATVSPQQLTRGAGGATLTVTGSGFVAQSVVRLDGVDLPTVFVSATTLQATVAASDLAVARQGEIRVFTPPPGGGASSGTVLTVANAAPVVTSLSPAGMTVETASPTVTITGTGFSPNSEARVGGVPRVTTYVSPTALQVALLPADVAVPQSLALTVFTPAPGGGVSNGATLAVTYPVPALIRLAPTFVPTGDGPATLTLTGTGFIPHSQALVGGSTRQTFYTSATELRVTLAPADIAASGTLTLQVQNPAPGGGPSNTVPYEVRAPVPALTGLFSFPFAEEGMSRLDLDVYGTGFAANSVVNFGISALTPQMLSTTHLRVALGPEQLQAGLVPVWVTTPAPGGGTSETLVFTVSATLPTITSLGSAQTGTGQASYTLTVNGTNFREGGGSKVYLNGEVRPTTWVSSTRLDATLSASDLQFQRRYSVTVITNPGNRQSNALPFDVVDLTP